MLFVTGGVALAPFMPMILGDITRKSKEKVVAKHKIAVLPGDGIGKEVVPEGLKVLEAAAKRFGIDFQWDHFDWSCDYYAKHGKMMPDDWQQQIGQHEAIFFGAIGWPATVPDHEALWGSLFKFRREFDQYINLRPVRLMPGVPSPLADRKPGEIDFFIVRENTEGEYSNSGGVLFGGTEREVVIQESVFTRVGADRVLKFAFELARKRGKHLTAATKSNGISISMPWWDQRVADMAGNYPTSAGTNITSTFCARISCSILTGSTWSWLPIFRRYPVRSRPGLHRHDRHRAVGQPESRAQVSVVVRTGAWIRARHLRQGHRQPNRPDLERRADAGFPGLSGRIGGGGSRHRNRAGRWPAHTRHEGQRVHG